MPSNRNEFRPDFRLGEVGSVFAANQCSLESQGVALGHVRLVVEVVQKFKRLKMSKFNLSECRQDEPQYVETLNLTFESNLLNIS
jgi:hypothetical protein